MRIGSLLNESPLDSPTTDPNTHITSNTGNLEHISVRPAVVIKETLVKDTAPSSILSPSNPHTGPNQPYLPFMNVYREHPASSRGPYSGPSANSSTGATSPLETSITQQPNSSMSWIGGKPIMHHDIAPPPISGRTQQQQPLNVLPPFTTLVNMPQPTATMVSIPEGVTSPPSNHQHHSPQTDNGYLGAASYQTQYARSKNHYQHQQLHTQSHISYTSQGQSISSGGNADSLMRFAAVAMESATLGGRHNLEEVAAAEVLTGQRGSMGSSIDGDGVQSEKRNASIQIDPALRPEVHSTQGNTNSTSPMDLKTYKEMPLFRSSPEPAVHPEESLVETVVGTSAGSPNEGHMLSAYEFLSEEPKCSYCNVCTTGSPLRKVVSHIFGRNKLSTRQIPKNVWVYYCRKHYQRSRYRNPRGFARQQVLLVRRQCERLEQWGGVKQWVIKVRRREELRMNREGDNLEDEDMEEEQEEEAVEEDTVESNDLVSGDSSRRSSTTAGRRRSSGGGGSNWIMKHTGPDRTIQDVYRLLDKIEIEVQENGGKFPDVELLPSVDLALAVSIGMSKKSHPDDMSDDNGGHSQDPGPSGSPKSKKRGRAANGGGRDTSGLANKKAKSSDTTKTTDTKGKTKPSESDEVRPDSISPRTRTPISSRPFSGKGRYELSSSGFEYQGSLEMHRLSHSPVTPSHSTSGESRRSSASWVIGVDVRGGLDPPNTPFSNPISTVECVVGSPSRSSRALPSPQGLEPQFLPTSPLSQSRASFTPRQLANTIHQFPPRKQRNTREDGMAFRGPLEPRPREGKEHTVVNVVGCITVANRS
ncbi:hypothetical protein BDD12DRAFT_885028 [Trichophaea hybrida]|nr:hypothetical protein BDD12DRAFT_885028 [Trichophaea hybrida]